MGLLDRTWRVIRANTRDLGRDWGQRQAADPARDLERALAQLQQELVRVRQAVARAVATQKSTERKAREAQQQAAVWQQRARLALQKNDETQARAALARRQQALETAATLETALHQERDIVSKLKADLQTLESHASTATLQKDLYLARARSAVASQQMGSLLGNRRDRDSLLARVADRVAELEAAAELAGLTGDDPVERQFQALEQRDRLDAELARLQGEGWRDRR